MSIDAQFELFVVFVIFVLASRCTVSCWDMIDGKILSFAILSCVCMQTQLLNKKCYKSRTSTTEEKVVVIKESSSVYILVDSRHVKSCYTVLLKKF